jgi:hypothetical protein
MKVRNLIFALVGAFLMVSFQSSFAQTGTTEKKPVKKVEHKMQKSAAKEKMTYKEGAVKDSTKKVTHAKVTSKAHHMKHKKETKETTKAPM